MYVCMYACMYVCMYVYIYIYIYTYAHIYPSLCLSYLSTSTVSFFPSAPYTQLSLLCASAPPFRMNMYIM